MLGFFTKLYLRALSLYVTLDSKVIFIILIIILNLHSLNLNEFGCIIKLETFDMSLVARFCYKSVIINLFFLILQKEIKKKLIGKKKIIKQSIISIIVLCKEGYSKIPHEITII